MLHIILAILKIIGILLAAVIGLLLLLLFCILFCPVGYELSGFKYKEIQAKGKIHWLFHIVTVVLIYDHNKFSYKLKLLGITINLKKLSNRFLRKKAEGPVEGNPGEDSGGGESQDDLLEIRIEDRGDPDLFDKKALSYDSSEPGNPLEPGDQNRSGFKEPGTSDLEGKEQADQIVVLINSRKEKPKRKARMSGLSLIKDLFLKIKKKITGYFHRFKNLKSAWRKFCSKIRRMKLQIKDIREFLNSEELKEAVKLGKTELLKILKHIKPERFRGTLHFGAGDPAWTGQILGVISILYPILKNEFLIRPDFEEKILEGDIDIRGRIRMIRFVRTAWTLYRDKNIRKIIKRFNK